MPNEQPIAFSGSYPSAFIKALERVFADESGYTPGLDDPGGPTKFGISQRQYPALDIHSLTRAEAAAIYYRDWWLRFDFAALRSEAAGHYRLLAAAAGSGGGQSAERFLSGWLNRAYE